MENQTEKISGVVQDIIFQNDDNGYTVAEIYCDGEDVVCTGYLGNIYPGEKLSLSGLWTVNSTYGRQFKAEMCSREMPETSEEMLSFLSSGLIKGIRDKTAQKIVALFGNDTFRIIKDNPERLSRIKGITKERAREISKSFKQLEGERNALISLEKYGLSDKECIKAYKAMGNRCVALVEENPFILCGFDIGISFDKACEVASRLPVSPPEMYRREAGIIYILKHNLGNGHTCIPRKALYAPACEMLGCGDDECDEVIDSLITQNRLVSFQTDTKELVFLPQMYKAEKSSADSLLFLKHFAVGKSERISSEIENSSLISGVVYNEKQLLAIKTAAEKGILILTGGPGTGKTTTLRGILSVFESRGLDVCLTAPTGRAAKRMSELTGKEAKTIHRLLEAGWDENEKQVFQRNRRKPLECDAVIVDELSMVDSLLFAALLDALPIGCRLVLVGDSDQLPSVGAGNVLHDLIHSKTIPVVKLDEVFRQAMESLIVTNAHKIVDGEYPDLSCRNRDFFFIECKNPLDCAALVSQLYSKRLPDAYNYNLFDDIQVLCPSKKGSVGAENLNSLLQSAVNPPSIKLREHKFGSRIFRENDKVMQNKNNYNIGWELDGKPGKGIFNGDIGVIKRIDEQNRLFEILFDDKLTFVPFENSQELDLAYAVTVHKSQGNEFRCVILPVTGVPEMLTYRNLFYTAVTRAKEIIVLAGSRETVRAMVDNDRRQKRYSGLKYFMAYGDTGA
ncbi:MAG: ATP-dependent RecD-like DNA helicase [Clostridiales bacterium]|nr:ATP-dependent RecD-like DNA helicase [Clostridiales bacterium]